MAISFAGGTDRINLGTNAAISAGCISFWLKTTQATASVAVATLWSNLSRFGFGIILDASGKISAQGYDTSTNRVNVISTTSVNDGTWRHFVYNWNTANGGANTIYVNGSSEATGNSSAAWSVGSPQGLGLHLGDPVDSFWATYNGHLAEVGLWTRNLDAAEITALSKGYSPKLIAPASLNVYMPLVRDAHNKRDSTLTVTGTTVSDHPRIMGALV